LATPQQAFRKTRRDGSPARISFGNAGL